MLGLKNDPSTPEVMMKETVPALDRWAWLMVQFQDYEIKASNEAVADANNAYASSFTLLSVLSGTGIPFVPAQAFPGETVWHRP